MSSTNKEGIIPQIIEINDIIGEKCDLDLEILQIPFNNFDRAKTSSKTMGNIKAYAANTYQGLVRNYNEDRVSIIINMTRPENYTKKYWPKISFFGIYDGHGGSKCADFLRDSLHKIIFSNEYFPENVDIDYNGKHTPWEAVVLLPFLDEKKVLELEEKDRKLSKEEEIYDKWGKSFKFEKNEINSGDIIFNEYEIYQNKKYDMISNYDKKKIDYTFPTLKTINYDYSLVTSKIYFGKNISKTT